IRLGTPAGTTRGFGAAEFRLIGASIADVLEALAAHPDDNGKAEAGAREKAHDLCRRFPIYPDL
ncbi:MAG: serine hydroxymethyltransferase, partial [Pseudomonadota bacterium]